MFIDSYFINGKLKKLRDFYLLDDKLLYVCDHFIGFDPLISIGMAYEDKRMTGAELKKRYQFEMGGTSFVAILTSYLEYGPLRGFSNVQIIGEKGIIINYEAGSKGHALNYQRGERYHIDQNNAYLVDQGYGMEDSSTGKIYSNYTGDNQYLLWFKDIVIPTKHEGSKMYSRLLQYGRKYSRADIEPLRQVEWETNVNFNNHNIRIIKRSVPDCLRTLWTTEGNEEFERAEGLTALEKIEFIFGYPI